MEIQSNLVSFTPVKPGKPGASHSLLLLQIGQLLNAKVLSTLESNRLLLEINGHRLVAATNLNARHGQILTLEVLQTGPTPRLKTVTTCHASQIITQQAARTLLPRQAPLDQALTALQSLYQQPQALSALRPSIHLSLATLFKAIPKREALTNPATLPALLSESGVFHEAIQAKTTSTSGPPPQDIKAHLLRLSMAIKAAMSSTRPLAFNPPTLSHSTLSPIPLTLPMAPLNRSLTPAQPSLNASPTQAKSELTSSTLSVSDDTDALLLQMEKNTTSALARLILDQLASLPKNESALPVWHFEIPYFQGEILERLRLTITQESRQGKPENLDEPIWSVVLELAPECLGEVRIKITVQGDRIHSYFWSEKPTTRQLFEKHFEYLQSQLQKAGLDPKILQTAKTVAKPQPATSSQYTNLINVTT